MAEEKGLKVDTSLLTLIDSGNIQRGEEEWQKVRYGPRDRALFEWFAMCLRAHETHKSKWMHPDHNFFFLITLLSVARAAMVSRRLFH